MTRKPGRKRKQLFLPSEHLGLMTLLVLVFILLGVVFFFFGRDLIPDDMSLFPTLSSETEETPSETQTDISDAPVVHNPILITEVQSSNRSTLRLQDESAPDWIELYNSGHSPVDLAGYAISDNLNRPNAFVFESVILNPQERLVVYASGLSDDAALEMALEHNEIHLPFRLAQAGEDLVFTNPGGQVLARLTLPEIPTDLSWGLLDDAQSATDPYYFFSNPTPSEPNGMDGFLTASDALVRTDSSVIINEYVTIQDQLIDQTGDTPDWVELYNTGTDAVNLQGFFLSDDIDDPEMWVFPNVVIEANDYLVVYLSGQSISFDTNDLSTLHATFRLGSGDEHLLLTDPSGRPVAIEPLQTLPLNVSYGRNPDDLDDWLYFPKPTPGQANETQGFETLDGALKLENKGFWINEVMGMGTIVTQSGKIENPDWIELYNATDQTIDLTGFGLSDNRSELYRERLDGLVIPPDGYTVIEPDSFGVHSTGETIYLTDPSGWIHDRIETRYQRDGISTGRADPEYPADHKVFFETPTRGSENDPAYAEGFTMQPLIQSRNSLSGDASSNLYFQDGLEVTLETPQPNAVIYFTLDGSEPDRNALQYTEPFQIEETTVVRCRAYLPSQIPSKEAARTYLNVDPHDLPVVSLLGDNDNFFDPVNGVWANYEAKIEQPIQVEFYETDGTQGVSFAAGVELHGSFSRMEEQKSMELKIRTAYGDRQVTYPFFPDQEITTFKRLILRTSGQDWRYTKLRDAFMTEVIKEVTEQETMNWRPCVVYINGEYFGLYYLREKVDQHYAASHHGADPDNIDMIKGNFIILNGDYDAYGELLDYVKTHDMRDPEAYQKVLSQIDEESLMDFVITQTFFNNLDSGNKKFWRERQEGAEWRWVFFDLDWAMFPSTYTKNILKYDLLDPQGHGQNDYFDTTLQVKLMENPEFREAFIQRYAWYLNHVFVTDRMLNILDEITGMIRSEMPRHIDRWGRPLSMPYWEDHIAQLRQITSEKRERTIKILQDSFNLTDDVMRGLFPEDYS